MNKKHILLFILLSIVGSALCYNAGNFIFADVANYTYGWNGLNILVSIPGFIFALESIALTMLVLRYYNSVKYRKRTLLLYIRIIMVFSFIGVVGGLLAAIFSYENLLSLYPFPYYLLICLMFHLAILILSFIFIKKIKKNVVDDNVKRKISLFYVIYSIFLPGFIFFAYNRFGAILFIFTYLQTSTLYITWPLFVWLILPMAILYYIMCVEFNIYQKKLTQLIHLICFLILNISLGISYFISSSKNSLYISAVSPAFGLDRLATTPIVVNFHFYFIIAVVLICIIRVLLSRKEVKL